MGEAMSKNSVVTDSGGAIVLKMDLNCSDCVSRAVECIRGFEGVENVKVDVNSNKLMVTGKCDPVKLRKKLDRKTHMKVEIRSPSPKKVRDDGKENKKKSRKGSGGGGATVLKMNLNCDGCVSRAVRCIRDFEGVENVEVDVDSNKLMVTGKFDPVKLREKLERKTHKKVEIRSSKDAGGVGKWQRDAIENKRPVTKAVLKVRLDVNKTVTKTKGYADIKFDTVEGAMDMKVLADILKNKQKDLVTVEGAIDMKVLADISKKQLKMDVEIVPPEKDKEEEKVPFGINNKH